MVRADRSPETDPRRSADAWRARRGPVRPWLGFYVADSDDKLVVMGLANKGPAQRAEIETGDTVLAVDGVSVDGLADLFRKIWAMGQRRR